MLHVSSQQSPFNLLTIWWLFWHNVPNGIAQMYHKRTLITCISSQRALYRIAKTFQRIRTNYREKKIIYIYIHTHIFNWPRTINACYSIAKKFKAMVSIFTVLYHQIWLRYGDNNLICPSSNILLDPVWNRIITPIEEVPSKTK